MTPDQAKSAYRRQLQAHGEMVTLQRVLAAPASPSNLTVRGRIVSQSGPINMVNSVGISDVVLIVLAEDVDGADWPGPPRRNDKIIIGGRTLNIGEVDDRKRRVAGVLIAYELTVRG